MSIYTKDGEFVHSVQLDTHISPWLQGVTVTIDGHIAVTSYGGPKGVCCVMAENLTLVNVIDYK